MYIKKYILIYMEVPMHLGTVVYENKIYNLDYMSIEEMKELMKRIEEDKKNSLANAKKIVEK